MKVINKLPMDDNIIKDWIDLNDRFTKRQKAYEELSMLLEKKAKAIAKKENQYFWDCWVAFNDAFKAFEKNNIVLIEDNKDNFIIDLGEPFREMDGSMHAHFWVQPVKPTLHRPNPGAFPEITIYGLLLDAKINFIHRRIKNEQQKRIRFTLVAYIQPSDWRGRNELNYNTSGKTIQTGFNRLIVLEANLYDLDFLEKIKNEFSSYFYAAMSNYFL